MSERTELAEHVTGLGVAGLAMMGTQVAPLVSVAVLAAWGIDRFNACRLRKQRKIVDAVIKQIEKANPDHRAPP